MRYTVSETGWLDGKYRRKDEIVEMSDEAAKWLRRSGQLVPAPANATRQRRDPLDHDGDGKPGGSKPAVDVDSLTAAGLATAAELGTVDYNTLRVAARRFLGEDVPVKKADIIAMLHARGEP